MEIEQNQVINHITPQKHVDQISMLKQIDNSQQKTISPLKHYEDFPPLKCAMHQLDVVLVCPFPECTKNIFLCPKCVSKDLSHLNEHNPLMAFIDFIEFLKEFDRLDDLAFNTNLNLDETTMNNDSTMIEEQQEVSQEQGKHFINQCESQQQKVSGLLEKLQSIYVQKCQDLVKTLSSSMEDQKTIFNQNWKKYQNEKKSDKHLDAEIPTFNDLKASYMRITDDTLKGEFLAQTLRKKQSWKNASSQLKSIGKRLENYYLNQIISQMQSNPFLNEESIIIDWTQGIDNLIQKVTTQSTFSNDFRQTSFVQVDIFNAREIQLLTTESDFSNDDLDTITMSLQKLLNLTTIRLDFTQNNQISSQTIIYLLTTLKSLQFITDLTLCLTGVTHLTMADLNKIFTEIGSFTALTKLRIEMCQSNLTETKLRNMGEFLVNLVNLTTLDINLKNNQINLVGFMHIVDQMSKLTKLHSLSFNIGGFSQRHSTIKEIGAQQFFKTISNLSMLESLNLDFSRCSINDSFINEFYNTLVKNLTNLTQIQISFANNSLTFNSMLRMGKCFSKIKKLAKLELNLAGNFIQNQGVNDLMIGLKTMSSIQFLTINLRGTQLTKDCGCQMLKEIEESRQYKNYQILF